MLLSRHKDPAFPREKKTEPTDNIFGPASVLDDLEDIEESGHSAVLESLVEPVPVPSPDDNRNSLRRVLPDKATQKLYDNWLLLIPTLDDEYLNYMQSAQGRLGRPLQSKLGHCVSHNCTTKTFPVQCLHFDRM